jgi:hypothetical protein
MVSYIDLGREGLEFGVLYICGHHVDQWTLPYQDSVVICLLTVWADLRQGDSWFICAWCNGLRSYLSGFVDRTMHDHAYHGT